MKIESGPAALVAAIGVSIALFMQSPAPVPEPDVPEPAPVKPAPKPKPAPPSPAPKPWGDFGTPLGLAASVGAEKSPDGKELIQIDLPGTRHVRNRGGSDGLGLCVFASMRHTGDWQGEPTFYDIFEWMFTKPGGGYPEKVDSMLRAMCAQKGYTRPDYVHVRDNDFEALRAATANGLMPCVSYTHSATGRYGGGKISHMVSLSHATDKWFCILDNNYPGEDQYEWLSPSEFRSTFAGEGMGWAMILLSPPPPPAPHNGDRS